MPETPLPTPNSVVTTTCVVPYLQNKRSSCSMLFICLSNLPNSFRSHQQATGERDSLQSTVAPMKTFWYPHMITTLLQLALCVCVCPFLDCIFSYMYVNFTPKTIKQSCDITLNLQSPERCRKNNNRCVFPCTRTPGQADREVYIQNYYRSYGDSICCWLFLNSIHHAALPQSTVACLQVGHIPGHRGSLLAKQNNCED